MKLDKREQLLQAALELFAEQGFRGTSTAQIAKHAGVATLDYFTGKQRREPETALPSLPVATEQLGNSDQLRVTWFGHSTCLIEIDGRTILTDPGEVQSFAALMDRAD